MLETIVCIVAVFFILLVVRKLIDDYKKEQNLVAARWELRNETNHVSGFADSEITRYRKNDRSPWLTLDQAYEVYLKDREAEEKTVL